MPGSSSTNRIFAGSLIGSFLCWRLPPPACKAGGRKTCSLCRHSPPRFFLPWPAPGGAQSPVPVPCLPDFHCREGEKNRQKLPDETPPESPARCRKHLPLRHWDEKHSDAAVLLIRRIAWWPGVPTYAVRRAATPFRREACT